MDWLERSIFRDLCSSPTLENAAAYYHILKRSQGLHERMPIWVVDHVVAGETGEGAVHSRYHLTSHGAYQTAANLISEIIGDRVDDENEGNMEWVELADGIAELLVAHDYGGVVTLWAEHPLSYQDQINVYETHISP